MSAKPDYQSALGFELVTVIQPNGVKVYLIREAGAEDREATLTERVLWAQMTGLLDALQEVLKHEKWHAAVADEVTPAARAAIKQAEAAIAKATGSRA